jgi:ribosomal protein S18 acetylase RimI-like enzyme
MSNTDTPGSRTLSQDVVAHRATVADATGISAVWKQIVAERRYSAVAHPWSASEEAAYIGALSSRESVFVASADGRIVGFQSLDRWVSYPSFVDHVGQLGTFVLAESRGRGIGRMLAQATFAFARAHGYQKLVVWVRASNEAAQKFYRGPRLSRVRSALEASHDRWKLRRRNPDGAVPMRLYGTMPISLRNALLDRSLAFMNSV